MRAARNVLTTLHTATKSRTPRAKTGSSTRQLVMYVKGTWKRRRTLPVAKRPHWVSRRRVPSASGRSSSGPQSRTGTFRSLARRAQTNSVPKLQCGRNRPSTPSARNFSTMRRRSPSSKRRPSSLMSSMSTNSTSSSRSLSAMIFLYFTASGAEKMLRRVGA